MASTNPLIWYRQINTSGSDINAPTGWNGTGLLVAISFGNYSGFEFLVQVSSTPKIFIRYLWYSTYASWIQIK